MALAGKYGHNITVTLEGKTDKITIYVLEDGIAPKRFQIFSTKGHEGFLEYKEDWTFEKSDRAPGLITEEIVHEIGNYLLAYY
jgi:hypothetical protein